MFERKSLAIYCYDVFATPPCFYPMNYSDLSYSNVNNSEKQTGRTSRCSFPRSQSIRLVLVPLCQGASTWLLLWQARFKSTQTQSVFSLQQQLFRYHSCWRRCPLQPRSLFASDETLVRHSPQINNGRPQHTRAMTHSRHEYHTALSSLFFLSQTQP